jgi:DNA-binding NarL/FixJ family response regulator
MLGPVATTTVLIADDNERFLGSAAGFLAGEPGLAVVACARSGEEAVALAERLRPDVVLMDLQMPGIGGLEATRRIKAGPRPPRVIVLTLHDTPRYRTAAAEVADAFVPKDALVHQLVAEIRRLARGPADPQGGSA